MREVEAQLGKAGAETLAAVAARLRDGIGALEQAVQYVVSTYGVDVRRPSVGAVPFLELFGTVAGGWQMARAALAAHRRLAEGTGEAGFYRAKLTHRPLLRRSRPHARPRPLAGGRGGRRRRARHRGRPVLSGPGLRGRGRRAPVSA